MIKLIKNGVYIKDGLTVVPERETAGLDSSQLRKATIAYQILSAHNTSGDMQNLGLRYDALVSHDITYVGIVQTARASGLTSFPVPYALTNCHNSLCAVGGTINEDDHVFGLSAAQKYGGIFVPPHLAVIHQYAREMMTRCGSMILGSDSHTRYGALGTMGVGEGGPEIVKQLLKKTYDVPLPEVVAVYLDGEVRPGVGPQDVALAIIRAVFENGFVNNKVLEFVGPGLFKLSVDFRNGIDVMTTETTCLSSIWMTDSKVEQYFSDHNRANCYKTLSPGQTAYYDGLVQVNLSEIIPMIALPFHPSNVFSINELNRDAGDILRQAEKEALSQLENDKLDFNLTGKVKNGRLQVDQGIVAGCAGGTFENLCEMASILERGSTGCGAFSLSAYPASQPQYMALLKNGAAAKLMGAGVVMKTAFCGPCFGAGDTPANGALSIRHTTRNFPSREGSKPGDGQISSVALMDARSIAATALNGGTLTGADEIRYEKPDLSYRFDEGIYQKRVYNGYGKPDLTKELIFGPNIADWPKMSALPQNILLKVVSLITDPVTTTDELIPSGETSSYRSNPLKLAEFTLSRKDSGYVGRAKKLYTLEERRLAALQNAGGDALLDELKDICKPYLDRHSSALFTGPQALQDIGVGSVVYAVKPGDGSAREQAASCQKVLGGWANICREYATKRYRSNLINWGMLPFTLDGSPDFAVDDYILVPDIRRAVESGKSEIPAVVISQGRYIDIVLKMGKLTCDERDIILAGCLINYYSQA